MNGKGSKRRPRTISRAEEQLRWDMAFNKKPEGESMKTYLAVSWTGETTHISAYTSSDAYEQAASFCGESGIKKFEYANNQKVNL